MKQSFENFLEFNGKTLIFLAVDGTYLIAVKPVCEALGVVFDRQYRALKADPILGPAWSIQPMQVQCSVVVIEYLQRLNRRCSFLSGINSFIISMSYQLCIQIFNSQVVNRK